MARFRTPTRTFITALATITLIGLLLAVPPAHAQEEEVTVQVVQVDDSRFPEIDVYVSVTDGRGQPVADLEKADFRLKENSEGLSLADFYQAGEQGPVTAVLVIDRSGSMNYAGKMEAAREAAVAFVELMRPGDQTGVIAFNTQVTAVQPLTGSQQALIDAINTIEPVDDTALYDALHEAAAMLEPVSGRTAIIAVTDGMNTAGTRTLEDTLTLIDEQGLSIYTIGLGDPAQGTGDYGGIDEETLQTIAEASSGIYQFTPAPEELSGLYERLSFRLQNEYKLTYRSPTPLRDGVNRDVVVSVARASGSTEVTAGYNPGGVIPEVASRPTWGLFIPMFAALAVLLILPGAIGKVRALAAGGDRSSKRTTGKKSKSRTKRAASSKSRVRLTGESRTTRTRKKR